MLNAIGGSKYDAGVLLTSDSHIQEMNRQYRSKDAPTDVLSFRYHDIKIPGQFPRRRKKQQHSDIEDFYYLGDILISVPYVERYCLDNNRNFDDRMRRLLAHGICHLLGYDHECDTTHRRMTAAEDFILSKTN